MPHDLPKTYEPGAIEARWAEYWTKEKLFSVPTPPPGETRPVFTLLLPPPNVTGRLHMGHMLNQTQMDIIVRWHRMRGFLTLWLPGTDHAGIATQMMVERQLASEGKERRDLGREKFVERVWEDRKSTRLNSSHLVISYAVFCLKKKKKIKKIMNVQKSR